MPVQQDVNTANPEAGLPAAPQEAGLPMTNRAFPEPPPGYMPGPTSAAKMFDEDSLSYKIGTTLMSIAQGEPVHLKLKLAQQEADRKQQETKLGWDNYYKSAAQATMVMQKQNRDAMMAGLEAIPKLKYQVAAITDPVERKAYAKSASAWLNSTSPGMGDHLMKFADNPSLGYAMDGLAEDPDYGDAFKEIIARVGVPEAYSHPQWQKIAAARNHDMMSTVVLHHFNDEDSKKLHAGKMTEDEFRAAHDRASKDALVRGRITQRDVLGMKLYLSSPEGVEQMANNGVQTNKAALAHQVKQKEQGPIAAQQDVEFKKRQEILNDPDREKKYNPAYIKELEESQQIAMKQMAPRSNPSDTPNNPLNQRLLTRSKGKIGSVADIAKLPPKEQPAMYAMAEQVQNELDSAKAKAGADAQEGKAADTTGYYNIDTLKKTGKLVPVRGRVSIEDLRSNPAYGKFSPKQIEQLTDMSVVEGSYGQIFDAAKGVYADGGFLQSQAESALISDPTNPINAEKIRLAKKYYPELAAYVSRREATLGKFARSISGEVGVLTDQDVVRVRNLFPTAGDPASVIASKKKALEALVKLNKKFLAQVLTGGEFDPARAFELKNSDEYINAKEGILGSVEGLSSQPKKKSAKSGVSALIDDMEAGK